MKQVSGLPVVGKKMTIAEMKALKGGGRAARGCPTSDLSGYMCNNCCFQDPWECRSYCGFFCNEGLCLA